jgi:co-chaperonin GroES (HSP10)
MKIYPCNRYLLIEPQEEEQEESAVLLPEDYRTKPIFSTAKLLVRPEECKLSAVPGENVVYQTNMVEEIDINGQKHYLLLENHVLCVVSED